MVSGTEIRMRPGTRAITTELRTIEAVGLIPVMVANDRVDLLFRLAHSRIVRPTDRAALRELCCGIAARDRSQESSFRLCEALGALWMLGRITEIEDAR